MRSRLLVVLGLLLSSILVSTYTGLASVAGSPYDDEFDSSTLNSRWYWIREDPTHWSLVESSGYLQITTQSTDIWEENNNAPILLQSSEPFSGYDFGVSTRVVMTPTANHHQGGVVIYADDDNYVRLTFAYIDGPTFEFAEEVEGSFQPIQIPAPSDINDFHLRIVKQGTDYHGYYSQDGTNWTLIGTHQNVAISPMEIGLLAFNAVDVTTIEVPADFDYFHVDLDCEVPFFWQRDPDGVDNHPLRGTCGIDFDTIGEGGCTLTSAAMLFRYYGADVTTGETEMTPPNLSDCMSSNACPFNWITGAACSDGRVSNPRMYTNFSYAQLDQELNQNNRPVILQMCRPKGNCSWEGPITHWVLVVGGKGTDPANYTIWDPWFECGQSMRLNSRSETWDFVGMAGYDGTPTCSFSTEIPLCARSASPVSLPALEADVVVVDRNSTTTSVNPSMSSSISGTAILYRATDITMTAHLTAQSNEGNVTEMVVWSDTISNTIWQPFASYVWLPLSDFVYVKFRDDIGNVSNTISDTPNPSAPPVAPDPERVCLPLVLR